MSITLQPHSIGIKKLCILFLFLLFSLSTSFSQTSIFTTQTPVAVTDNDHKVTVGQEVGVKFTSSAAGFISGIRFYKTAGNSGTHTGELYSSTGVQLAQANFTGESATGWQTVFFPSPVAITAGTTYTAAYFSSLGNYVEDNNYFKGHSVTNSFLTAPADGTNGASGTDPGNGQGMYKYSTAPAFPNQLYKSANYWVDVIFSTVRLPDVEPGGDQTIVSPISFVKLNGFSQGFISGTVTSSSWKQISGPNTAVITPNTTQPDVTGLIQGVYVFQFTVTGPAGSSSGNLTVTVLPPGLSPNIFTTQTATTGTLNAGQGIELGVKFKTSLPGYITGIRFYKTSGNTGTHTGELYSSSGTRLAQAVFINETATGWQTVTFSSPVAIAAGTTYVAAYFSPSGTFTSTAGYFVNDIVNNPLIALKDGEDGPNGVFNNSSTPSFPVGVHPNTNNYWVDVVYSNGTSSVKADAGLNQMIYTPAVVTLNGSGSTGTINNYLWTLISSPSTGPYNINPPVITTPDKVSTTVTGVVLVPNFSPHGTEDGTYIFQLSLNGGASVSQITIVARNPVANAGPDQVITLPVTSAILDASASTGTSNTYLWTQNSGPNTASITQPTFVSTPVTGLIQGTYVFQVTLNGGPTTIIPEGLTSIVTIKVNPPAIMKSTVFTTQTPLAVTDNDHQATVGQEVGLKFKSTVAGYITGVRFYKTSGNSGTHIGELYSAAGTRLAQATFTGETATGWQNVSFSSPVAIAANTTYTAAYFSSLGNYTEDNDYFLHHSVTNSPLTAPEDGTNGASGTDPGAGQGTYKYTASAAFPNQLYRSANYWVDPIFSTSNTVTADPSKLNAARAVDGVSDSTQILAYSLSQNYPNPAPMSQKTKIEYSVPTSSKVELLLFDMQGRPVKIMVNEMKNAGRYSYDLNTGVLAKGLYIYSMHAGSFYAVKKLVIQ
jgi:Domain of unknown function (DUF4082)/Secretion system C-terminal sorting domain